MQEVTIDLSEAGVQLCGSLTIPDRAKMIVAFAHGSGSGRFSPRNRQVAAYFNQRGLGTLLLDLLTEAEGEEDEMTRQYRFDIPLLASRLTGARKWLQRKNLKVGLYGSSTGAAAALIAAAEAGSSVAAVVSRGGRTDLADSVIAHVKAPTLFIVGGLDAGIIELNEASFDLLTCEKRFEIVEGATHLFEEPGALEVVAKRSADWYSAHSI